MFLLFILFFNLSKFILLNFFRVLAIFILLSLNSIPVRIQPIPYLTLLPKINTGSFFEVFSRTGNFGNNTFFP